MPKTKLIRVATSGDTIDGRKIEPAHLQQAARNYNRHTYAARINIEHIRGVTGQPPFQAYGDVLSLKTEDVELDIAGKKEKRVALFAEIDATDALVELNRQGQKLYSSIELLPNFAGKGEAYMIGLAMTDSPAALGTERLHFTAHAQAHGNLVSPLQELSLELADAPAPTANQTAANDAFAAMRDFFTGFGRAKPEPAPAVIPPSTSAAPDFAAFSAHIGEGFAKIAGAIEASDRRQTEAVARVAGDLAAFKQQLAQTPAANYTARPTAAGGDGVIRTDC